MDENPGNNKILGLESGAYLKLCYVLILVAGGLGLLLSVLGAIGLGGGGSGLLGLLGLAGLVMALIGWIAFPKEFTVIELSHLRYLSILFIVFYVAILVIASVLGTAGLIWTIISFLAGAAQVLLSYLGFRLWQKRQEPTQDSLKAEFESLKTYIQNRSDL